MKAYKKGCPDFRRNSLLPVIRQKSRYIRAQQQTGQSSAQKQQGRSEGDFVLRKDAGGAVDVHRDSPRLYGAFFERLRKADSFFKKKCELNGKKVPPLSRRRAAPPAGTKKRAFCRRAFLLFCRSPFSAASLHERRTAPARQHGAPASLRPLRPGRKGAVS